MGHSLIKTVITLMKRALVKSMILLCYISVFHFSSGIASNLDIRNGYLRYKVKEGEELGKILQALGLYPIWGAHGYVTKTVKINAGILDNNGDFILPGQSIKLPVQTLVGATSYKIEPNGHVSLYLHQEKTDKAVEKNSDSNAQ